MYPKLLTNTSLEKNSIKVLKTMISVCEYIHCLARELDVDFCEDEKVTSVPCVSFSPMVVFFESFVP